VWVCVRVCLCLNASAAVVHGFATLFLPQLPENLRLMYDGYRFYSDVRRDFANGAHLQLPFSDYLARGVCSCSCVSISSVCAEASGKCGVV
jgi:hypothetical protein